jgi:hypothetical protein
MNFMTTFRSVVDRVQSRVIPETAQALTLLCKPVGLFCTERRVVRVMDSVKQQRRTRRHLTQHDPLGVREVFSSWFAENCGVLAGNVCYI